MTPERRTKLLRWLCLLAPLLSLASIVLLALSPLRGLVLQALQTSVPSLVPIFGTAPMIGWFMLTLGCSAVTALDLIRRRAKTGAALVFLSIVGTVLVFLAHLLVIGTIAFAGCMIVYNNH
jgi:hypothetical protein